MVISKQSMVPSIWQLFYSRIKSSVTTTQITGGTNVKINTAIYLRDLREIKTPPIFVFDLSSLIANSPSINNITICKDDIYTQHDEFYLAFDSGNKLFVLKLIYSKYFVTTSTLSIIYGNLNPGNSAFTNNLNSLISQNIIQKLKFVASSASPNFYQNDLSSSQKVGFVNYDGIYNSVQFINSGSLYEILFDKNFTLQSYFRLIGTI
jgi:hypothetical protein